MTAFRLVSMLFVAAVAIYLIAYLGRAMFMPLFRSLGAEPGMLERRKLKRRQSALEEADRAIDEKRFEVAAQSLRNAVFLDIIQRDLSLIPRVGALHLSLLNKLILLAELRSYQLSNLPLLEELFSTRVQLLKSWNEAKLTRKESRHKKKEAGEALPDWAAKEYNKKVEDLADKLKTNRMSIESQLDKLFQELYSADPSNDTDVTYH